MLLMMLLTTETAWAFKTETPTSYTVSLVNNKSWRISDGTQATAQWDATTEYVSSTKITYYYWKANVSHNLANGMTIETNADVETSSVTSVGIHTTASTTFTFRAPSNIAITNVVFMNGGSQVSGTNSASGSTYTVTIAKDTPFTGFEVTYGYISGSCGTSATWTLSKQNGQYTALTISGSGAMKNDYGHETVDGLWRTNAPWDWRDLKSVTIENDITSIGQYTFVGCTQLSSLTIGTSVTTIGINAFDHCDALTQVTLPASVTTLQDAAFKSCTGLQLLNIQCTNGLVTLGSNVFSGCGALQYIVVPTPALALQYKDATNWSASKDKLRIECGSYLFTATNEGGTAAYAITNETDLRILAFAINNGSKGIADGKTFRQTAPITLSSTSFTPIGNHNSDRPFIGTYDGGGYTISDLHINDLSDLCFGLFSCVKGIVKNVRLVDPSVDTNSAIVGALIGRTDNATVQNCVVINPTIKGSHKGAIIGSSENSTFQNLYFYDGNCNNALGGGYGTNVGRVRKVTIGSGIGSITPAINSTATNLDNGFVYDNDLYYREGLTLALTSNLSATGQHVIYKAAYNNGNKTLTGNTYTVSSTDGDVTLTAELENNTYTVHFNGNGGTCGDGEMSDQVFTYGTPQNLTGNAFSRTGYTFLGWATSENGDVVYSDKQSVKNLTDTDNGTVTLYAKWLVSLPYIDANGNTQTCRNYTVLTNSTNISNLSAGWYVVTEDVSYSSRFYCGRGDIHLILYDGAKMTVETNSGEAIRMGNGSLTIYALSTGSSIGQLAATASNDNCIYANGSITICGGNITATATGNSGNGIFAISNITIHSGQVSASGRTYGIMVNNNNITLVLRNATDYITASSYQGTVNIVDGQTLTDGTTVCSGTLTNEQIAAIAGKTLHPVGTLDLIDNGNNDEAIREAATAGTVGRIRNVTLSGRTLYKDGNWNTLCLPFALSAEQIAASPLNGTTIMKLDGTRSDLTGGTLTLNFNATTEMEAGRPYIVKWPIARVISSPGDWHDFAADVAGGNTYENKVVRLAADIEVSEMVGTSGNKFKGIFDGQGHTLTLNSLSASGEAACAPFRYVEGATIVNLHTTGTVIADNNNDSKFRSGLVGQSDGKTTIRNCWNSVTIQSSVNGDGTHGGFIGLSHSDNATISNCRFDGSFDGSSTKGWGGFVGLSNSTTYISNSNFVPASISIDNTDNATFGRNQVKTTNCYYTLPLWKNGYPNPNGAERITSAVDKLASDLGSGWQVKDGKAVPVIATTDIVNPVFSGVTVSDATNDVAFTGGSFKGTYASITFNEENKSILLLGTNNTLYWPKPTGDDIPRIGAFRAYFKLNVPETTVRQFVLRFGEDGEAQGISDATRLNNNEERINNKWYTLDGVRLDGKPTKKGLYIHGSKKVVIP